MVHPAALPVTTSPAARHAAAMALMDRQVATLTRLTEIGMEFAEELLRALKADDDGQESALHDPELALDRVARAVRNTIALQVRLLKDQADLDRGAGLARTARADKNRDRARGLFSRALNIAEPGAHEARRLYSEAQERLRDEDESALADGPLELVVARICRALGLPADWAAENFPFAEAQNAAADADPLGPQRSDPSGREPTERIPAYDVSAGQPAARSRAPP